MPPTGEGTQPGSQLLVGERLDQVVVRAGIQPGHPVTDRVASGEDEDRDLRTRGPDPSRDLEPGHIREPEVEDDDFDARRGGHDVEAVRAGHRRLHDVAVLLEQAPKQADQTRVILDDEQMHGISLPAIYGSTVTPAAVTVGVLPLGAAPPRPRPPKPLAGSIWTSTVEPLVTAEAEAGVLLL